MIGAAILMMAFALTLTQIQPSLSLALYEQCINPVRQPGSCVYLNECPQVAAILKKPSPSTDERNFIMQSRCGASPDGKPLVCCAGPGISRRSSTLPGTNECGADLSDRIVGGQRTELGEFPWLALLKYRKLNGATGFHCGGSLINSRYVLTAAHCINSRQWDIISVRLGEHDVGNDGRDCDSQTCADPPLDVGVDKIKVHENYRIESRDNHDDIALVRLNRDVEFTDFIQPICLPLSSTVRNRNLVGKKATAAGWGRTETENASNVKLKVNLDVVDTRSCSAVYQTQQVVLLDTQFCAGGLPGKDTCSGDSGGPLMQRVGHNHFLYGIVSFGPNKCGIQGVPGVYTNVPKYIEWIQNNLE